MALNKYDVDQAIWPTVDGVVAKVRSLPRSLWLDLLREDQSRRWRGLYGVWVEEYLRLLPEVTEESGEDGLVLICGELELRRELGDQPQLQEYQQRFPQYARHLELQFTFSSVFNGANAENADCDTGSESDLVLNSKVPGLEILEEIGRGASSVVFRGRQASLNRNVAVKLLLSPALSAQHRERFVRESQIVGTIRHPNVVRVYDAIVHEGTMYLVMEFIDGPTLNDWAQAVPLQPKAACRLVARLADAMHAVHTSGVLHRDLKPTNILMTSQEEPVITDFGLARWIDSPADLTNEDTLLGTPSYMSPEQITRKHAVGPSADVYSMGAILYELLTGRPPFVAATVLDTLSAVLEQLPVRPKKLVAGIPKDVETICLKCLEKTPAARYPSASDLRDDLIRYLDGKPIAARPPGVVGQGIRWVRRNPVVAILVTAILLLICVSATGLVAVSQQRRQVAVDSLIEAVSSA
ncbi:MAG: serine/threonine protein kinase, partial [Planctomycetales bacterium]|nr:serine/threonine protein kinase [Planctomycetales bacterium]